MRPTAARAARHPHTGGAEEWKAFEVREDSTQNKKLMKFLLERRGKGKYIPLEQVEAELGLRQKG